ncbi:PLC-like phosphodiesterase [Auriculariales sp. MPI-PUGE-AT-0066]|nr:PLC-like phosphodiesterase [Auriculariales sp. MPI-PUGE-AT-0066]
MLAWSSAAVLLGSLPLALAAVDPTQLQQHLTRGVGILGNYSTSGSLTDWMAALDDSAALTSLNLPGTHDSAAWNPSSITKPLLQCQDLPIFNQLNAGVRFFDIRFGNMNGTLGLYHSTALLDPNAQLEDVLWGMYHWLDDHPTETLVVSLKVDSGDTTADVQQKVRGYTTSAPGSDYWITDATLGNLGAARGKMVLFRRFAYAGTETFGLDMTQWLDNASFAIKYADGATAYVEDNYELNLGNVPADTMVTTKLGYVTANLDSASVTGGDNATQLFITFGSGGGQLSSGYINPRTLALGSTSTNPSSTTDGVNAKLLSYLQQHSGARLGVVLLDFYNTPTDLVLAAIANSNIKANATTDPTPSSSGSSSGQPTTPAGGSAAVLDVSFGLAVIGTLFALVL